MIRDARCKDAARITEIFNQAIPSGFAVWREQLTDQTEVAGWIDGPAPRQAVLVAESASVGGAKRIDGFATLAPFKTGPGWQASTELSVYVAAEARGAGIGGRLIDAICNRAAEIGCATVVSAIDAANTGSVALHERRGFVCIGVIKCAGRKAGALRDVVLLQRLPLSSSAPVKIKYAPIT
ncbi:MAG: N-acetyltransferase family protein [Neomegalonema sp.]|nr:N-acetyltransferase family protein [Neomegalonema sp.]